MKRLTLIIEKQQQDEKGYDSKRDFFKFRLLAVA